MDTISFQDFQKLDIRIGTVVDAMVPEWSHWVMKLKVDLGPEIGTKTIFAGIMKHYKPEELVGKQFPFVANLSAKKIGPKEPDGTQGFSEGMMMAASAKLKVKSKKLKVTDASDAPDEEEPVLFKLWKKVPNGTKVR